MPKQWSTKDLHIVTAPTKDKTGVGVFKFTDDYSVFHYSKMPDKIPGKGEALCRMSAFTLNLLQDKGIRTHFCQFIAPNSIEIRLVRLLYPQRAEISSGECNYLIPLQVVCRNMLPKGSSVYRRLEKGDITLKKLGLTKLPKPDEILAQPIIEFTTKLEEIDRFISHEDARKLAGLNEQQFEQLKAIALRVNEIVTAHADSVGLVHADSKIELGIDDEGNIMVVDTVGTADENRFLYNGFHVTKQVMRDYYLKTDLERDIQQWVAMNKPRSTWPTPKNLPKEYIPVVANLYASICERWTGKSTFGAPNLDSVVNELKKLTTVS
jgi:phosphoribosylaminoimidazole-succinocarboxamide synthase